MSDPMDCSILGFPVLHHLPEFAQTHIHRVSDVIQPSHPLSKALFLQLFINSDCNLPILCRKHFQEQNFWDLESLHRVDRTFFRAVIFFPCSCWCQSPPRVLWQGCCDPVCQHQPICGGCLACFRPPAGSLSVCSGTNYIIFQIRYYIYFHIRFYKLVSIVPCAIQYVLVGYLFYMW